MGFLWTKIERGEEKRFWIFGLKKKKMNSAAFILNSDFFSLNYYFFLTCGKYA